MIAGNPVLRRSNASLAPPPQVGFSSAIFRCKALESISQEMVCILKGHGIDGHGYQPGQVRDAPGYVFSLLALFS